MNQLPQGWTTATLKDLVGRRGLFTDGDWILSEHLKTGKDVRLIQLADVGVGRFVNKSQKFISKTTADDLGVTYLRQHDVLISRMAHPLARACLFPKLEQPSITAVDVAIARPDQSVSLPQFIVYLCNSTLILNQAEAVAVGTTRKRISRKNLERLTVPLPPLNEQRRIVAKLEKLLSRVDAAQARLATIPHILKRFRQSVLAAACSGRLTADWRVVNPKIEPATAALDRLKAAASNTRVRRGVPASVQVSDLLAEWELPETWGSYSSAELLRCGAFVDVKDGNHGANHPKVSEFTQEGLPFITAAQVNNYRIDYEGAYKLSGKPLDRIRVGFAKPGDVIYTHKGSVGRVAVADRDCVLTPQTTYYRVNPEVFSNRFVMFYLASHAFSEQVNVVKEQTTRDFVPISEQYLLFHRMPPLVEQQEIVRRVEALFKTADALEARYRKAKAHVDKLTQSILAKAFRGELVPQKP